jgi:ATP-dependent helicase/nuclease subunit A
MSSARRDRRDACPAEAGETSVRTTPQDQAVRDRIVSDFDRNFLVEAGAGSGKTYSLAMRMAAGIERGKYRVGEMAAVTFTRKAAAELRGRFQLALEERLRASLGDAERQRLEAALAGIERLFAGTIHAFCAHLLRERPVDAHVAPGFEELGDVEDIALRGRAWRDAVVEMRAGGSRDLLDLLEAGVRPKDLEKAFATVCQHDDVEFDMGAGDAPDPAPVWQKVDAFWADLAALRPPAFHEATTCPVQRRFEELEGRLALGRPRRDRLSSLAGFLQAWGDPTITQKYWGKEVGLDAARGKRVAALVAAFQAEVVAPFSIAFQAYVHRLAMSVLLDARARYAEVRRRQNAVNYVDLLVVAARMLRERAEVRRALQAKYRWLFIDEFQDTDPLQAEIFLALAGDERGGLRPGALFVVGDPKQSIFRFRRADIDIYNRVATRIVETGGQRLSLTANFRSLPEVCALANGVFPPRFAALTPPYSPPFEKLEPVRPADSGGKAPGIAKLTIDGAEDAAARVAAEARAIAACIRAAVDGGRRQFGDFLVLTRLRTRLPVFVQALDALEIPVEVSGAGFFCKSPHVRTLAMLLAALADPLESVSIVGVLRGPLFGLSDPELFRFREAGGRFELNVPLPEVEDEKAEAALAKAFGPALAPMRRLHEMVRLTRSLPLGAAVDRILEDTGWLALASTMPGAAEAGHVLQAVDRVREVSEDGGGLVEAAAALNDGESSNESEALPLEPGRRNVVRLMNLHKAKGLEAPVVFLADATGDFTFPVVLRVVRTGDRAVGHLRLARDANFGHVTTIGQPRGWEAHEAEEAKYVAAERLRLLYVAGTRAKDLLVVCRSGKGGANKAWAEFEGFLAGAPEIAVPAVDLPKKKSDGALSAKARAEAGARRQAARDLVLGASWEVAAVTTGEGERGRQQTTKNEERRTENEQRRTENEERRTTDGERRTENEDRRTTDGERGANNARRVDAGTAWGTLVHGLLEHVGRHRHATRTDLERLARWLTVETPELRPVVPAALDLVEQVSRAPFWDEARGGGQVLVEVPFAVRIPAGQSVGPVGPVPRPTVLRGVIDLVYRSADGWRILDYKTDLATGRLERHAPQLAAYRSAWERVTSEPVASAAAVGVRS